MSNVTIYAVTITKAYMMSEQGTGYSLTPWSGDNVDYEGYDDGGTDYELPDGYTIGEDGSGQPHIYDADDRCCDIVRHSSGHPQLVSGCNNIPVLSAIW